MAIRPINRINGQAVVHISTGSDRTLLGKDVKYTVEIHQRINTPSLWIYEIYTRDIDIVETLKTATLSGDPIIHVRLGVVSSIGTYLPWQNHIILGHSAHHQHDGYVVRVVSGDMLHRLRLRTLKTTARTGKVSAIIKAIADNVKLDTNIEPTGGQD